jgi:hypothetical protein
MRIFSFVAAAICAVAATTAHAGVSGSALQTISGLKITKYTDNTYTSLVGDLTATTQANAADVAITTSVSSAVNSASLTGGFVPASANETGSTTVVANSIILQQNGAVSTSGDANVAFVGDAAAPANVADGANNFVALAGANGVRGDSSYAGSPVDLSADSALGGIGTPATASTYADFNVDQQGLVGAAKGDVNNTTTFSFTTASQLFIQIDFNHVVELALTDYAPAGPAYSAFALTGYTISLTTGGSPVLEFREDFRIDAPPFGGTLSHNEDQTLQTTLAANTNYTLTIDTISEVGFGVVPEPTSMAIFGFMGAGAAVSRRRRRK